MSFLNKISNAFKNLLPSKKDKDNINVPSEQAPSVETPSEGTAQEPEQEPIKQNFNASEGE